MCSKRESRCSPVWCRRSKLGGGNRIAGMSSLLGSGLGLSVALLVFGGGKGLMIVYVERR